MGLPLGLAIACSAGTGHEDTGFVCEPGQGMMCAWSVQRCPLRQRSSTHSLPRLEAIDQSGQITPNFTLEETAQVWKGRYAVVQPHAVAYLQDLRDMIGPIVVNSGYRSPGL